MCVCTTNCVHRHVPQLAEIVLQSIVKINRLCSGRAVGSSSSAAVVFTVDNLQIDTGKTTVNV